MNRLNKSHVLILAIGMILGAIALGFVQAQTSVSTDVRIGARQLADGRVEIGLQQKGDDGSWAELELPTSRFLPPNADIDEWRYSSELAVSAVVEEPEQPVIVRQPPIMCVFGHAYPSEDRFWQWTLAGSRVAGYQYGVDMRLYGARNSDEHAQDIADCLAQEPIAIATSLPYADDLAEVLAEARAAQIPLVTFNSGADDADSVGSLMHIGLDDFRGGVLAGDEFDDEGVTGTVLCVIHETDNVGLRDRCRGLEEGYDGGDVVELFVDLHGPADREEVQGHIAEQIAVGNIGGILTLNHDTGMITLAALEASESNVVVASFGFSDGLANAVREGDMLFLVWDHPLSQGYLAVSAMALAWTIEFSQLNAEVFLNGAKILIQPTLADQERAAELQSMFRFADQLGNQNEGAEDSDESEPSDGGGDQ